MSRLNEGTYTLEDMRIDNEKSLEDINNMNRQEMSLEIERQRAMRAARGRGRASRAVLAFADTT
jgi:hypothetical protein